MKSLIARRRTCPVVAADVSRRTLRREIAPTHGGGYFCSGLKTLPIAGIVLAAAANCLAATDAPATPSEALGSYFTKKSYQQKPLARFEQMRDRLPAPLLAEKPEWVSMYWKAWELAFKNFHEPAPGSSYVSQFIDAAFNQNIFLWDTCFMTMFCNYGQPLVPAIGSLDNFYIKQHEDGEICREIDRRTGRDFSEWVNREGGGLLSRWGWAGARNAPVIYRDRAVPEPAPRLTLDALNHPILAWAELESYRVTGDRERLSLVFEPLAHYYRALQKYLRQGNGLYMTDWASMDNSPRNAFLKGGGCAIDTSSQMVLFARNLATMAGILNKPTEVQSLAHDADDLARAINDQMWDSERLFYFDLTQEGQRVPVKTIAAFWTLIAGVASPARAENLVAELNNPRTFKRLHRVPTLAADQAGYDDSGGYWCGAVWAPTTMMVVRGLEQNGHQGLAREIALNHLTIMGQVFQKTGTIWENYAPESPNQGRPAKGDFVGWSGLGPILFLLEHAIGLKPDAARNELVWEIPDSAKVGCDRLAFNGHIVSLKAEPEAGSPQRWVLEVVSDGPFKLQVRRPGRVENLAAKEGRQTFSLR